MLWLWAISDSISFDTIFMLCWWIQMNVYIRSECLGLEAHLSTFLGLLAPRRGSRLLSLALSTPTDSTWDDLHYTTTHDMECTQVAPDPYESQAASREHECCSAWIVLSSTERCWFVETLSLIGPGYLTANGKSCKAATAWTTMRTKSSITDLKRLSSNRNPCVNILSRHHCRKGHSSAFNTRAIQLSGSSVYSKYPTKAVYNPEQGSLRRGGPDGRSSTQQRPRRNQEQVYRQRPIDPNDQYRSASDYPPEYSAATREQVPKYDGTGRQGQAAYLNGNAGLRQPFIRQVRPNFGDDDATYLSLQSKAAGPKASFMLVYAPL